MFVGKDDGGSRISFETEGSVIYILVSTLLVIYPISFTSK